MQLATQGARPTPAAREVVVPATCRVEKFLVDRAQDVGAPVTQLSDAHWHGYGEGIGKYYTKKLKIA